MSGYLVLPRTALDIHGGTMPAASEQIGFLDFLREIEQDPFPFAPRTRLCVTGLDELLIAQDCTQQRLTATAASLLLDYRRRLKRAAAEVNLLADIQVPVAYPLRLGGENDLGAHHTKQDFVPLWQLFGKNPSTREVIPGKVFGYHFAETLS